MLSFYVLNFDLALGSDFVYLEILDVVKFSEFGVQVFNLSKKLLFFELEV